MTGLKSPRRAAALLVTTAAVALAVAACGGGSSSSGTPTAQASAGTGGGNNAYAAYISCLNKNGVTVTMPSRQPGAGYSRGARPSGSFTRPSGEPRPSGSAGFRGGNGGFPGGGFGGGLKPSGVDDATWQKAQAACASVLPSGGAGRFGGGGANGANAAYYNCLKSHGVTVTGKLNTADPTTAKAMQTCKVLAPQPSATPSS